MVKGKTAFEECPFLYVDSWIETIVYIIIFISSIVRLSLPGRQWYTISIIAISLIRFINYIFHLGYSKPNQSDTWFYDLPYIVRHIFFVVPLSLLISVHRYLLSNFYKVASLAKCNANVNLRKWDKTTLGLEITGYIVAALSIIFYAIMTYALKSDIGENFYLSSTTNIAFAICYIILVVCDVKAIIVIHPFKKVLNLASTINKSLILMSITLVCYVIFTVLILYDSISMLVNGKFIYDCNEEYVTFGWMELLLFVTQVAPVCVLLLMSYIQTPWKKLIVKKRKAKKYTYRNPEAIIGEDSFSKESII